MTICIKKTGKRKIPILVVYAIFALTLSNWVINHVELNANEWAKLCSRASLILLLVQVVFMRMLRIKFFSLEFTFIILSYVFYLGQTFLLSIAYDFGDLTYSLAYVTYGTSYYVESTKYSFACIAFIFLGLMIGSDSIKIDTIGMTSKHSGLELNKATAKIMLVISTPFELYSLLAKLYSMMVGTYLDAHASGGGILVEFMSGIFFAAIMFFLIDAKNDRVQCRQIFIAILMYETLTMLTGQRAMGIIKIFICIFVYYNDGHKINWKIGVKLLAGVIVATYVLVVIRNSRADGFSLSSLNFHLNGFILFDMISEFGITGKVVTATFAKTMSFAEGKSLLCSFLALIPGWSNLFGNNLIDKYYTYVALNQQSWGSSFISDLYFDFGFNGGIIASCLYAIIVGMTFKKFNELMRDEKHGKAACYAYFVLQFIYTIRSYIFRIPRYFVYFTIIYGFCVLVSRLLFRRRHTA